MVCKWTLPNSFRSYRDSHISEPHYTATIISSPALLLFPLAVPNSTHCPATARWLIAHYHRTGITTFPFSKQFLAAQTGLEETLLAGLLAEFERYGLLETGYNTVKISQPEALMSRACMCLSLAKDATHEYLTALEEIQRLPPMT